MNKFYTRAANFDDFDAVVSLIRTHLLEDYQGEQVFSDADLQQMWEACKLETDTCVVVEPSAGVVAYAWFPYRTRDDLIVIDPQFFVPPDIRGQGVEMRLIEAAEKRRVDHPNVARIAVQPMVTNAPLQQALQQAGYSLALAFQKMVIALTQESEIKPPPAGIEIRPFVRQDEQKAYAADEEASLDKGYASPVPFDQWTSRMLNNPELCFLAWDGEQVAGGVYTQVYEGQGLVHHLGVRRPWRGRGLGARLMEQTFAACYQAGVRKVWLEVDLQSPTGANRLYERIGMRRVGVRSYYVKEINRWDE